MKIKSNYSFERLVPVLVDNIFEISNLKYKQLLKSFSKKDLDVVKILTVNRNNQHLHGYLNNFYDKIYTQ